MRRIGFLALAVAAISAQSAVASTISYLGLDTTTLAAWRSPGVAKTVVTGADFNGDNVYGTDGYYFARAAGEGAWNPPVESSLPSYISSVSTPLNGYGLGVWAKMDDPAQAPVGGLVADLPITTVFFESQPVGTVVSTFDITLASNANFVLTVLTGAAALEMNTAAVTVASTSAGGPTLTQAISPITASAMEYSFFGINGSAGETFRVSMTAGTGGQVSSAGLGFEAVPEPTSLGLLGLGSLALLKRRRA